MLGEHPVLPHRPRPLRRHRTHEVQPEDLLQLLIVAPVPGFFVDIRLGGGGQGVGPAKSGAIWRVGVFDVELFDPCIVDLAGGEGAGARREVLEGLASECTGSCGTAMAGPRAFVDAGGGRGGAGVGEGALEDVAAVGEEAVGEFRLTDGGEMLV